MKKISEKSDFYISLLFVIACFVIITWFPNAANFKLDKVSLLFVSIILEGLPFVLLGVFLSSLLHIYVSYDKMQKFIPKNKYLGIVIASVLGFIFPICECSIVPLISKLTKKGVPLSMSVTFLLSAPIINPVVILSTYSAFSNTIQVVFLRVIFGISIAILTGIIISFIFKKKGSYLKPYHEHHDCSCNKTNKFVHLINHTFVDFFDIGKFYILGALFSSLFQVYVPKEFLFILGSSPFLSIIAMMSLAFILSVCSEADAFIAKSLLPSFNLPSALSFIVYGPMIDLKNTIMLLNTFKTRFVIVLISIITVLNIIFAYGFAL